MSKYAAHIIFYSFIILYIIIAFLINNAYMGYTIGSIAAAITNPMFFGMAAVMGGILKYQKVLIPFLILYAIGVSYYIFSINHELGAEFTFQVVLLRFIALLFVAYITNAIVLYFDKTIETQPKKLSIKQKIEPIIKVIKAHFKTDFLYRIFVVLQILLILIFSYYQFAHSRWNLFDDLFNGWYWTHYKDNWLFLITVFSPYILIKSISWIQSAK